MTICSLKSDQRIDQVLILVRLFGPFFRFNFSHHPFIPSDRVAAFLHGVIRGKLKQAGIRLSTRDVGQSIRGFAHARIAIFAQYNGLQFGRIPAFVHRNDGTLIPDFSGGNGECDTRAFGLNALDGLRAQGLLIHFRIAGKREPATGCFSAAPLRIAPPLQRATC